jgi:hypothetical protein
MRSSRLPRSCRLMLGIALVLVTAATAAAQNRRFYLTKPFSMNELAPNRPAPRDNVAISVKSGGSQAFGEFSSLALPGPLSPGTAEVTLFLATGQQGMTGCAEVSVTLTRVAPSGRTLIGTAAVATSINPRRDAGPPIVLPVDVAGTALAAGDQIGLEIAVGNACGEGRNVTLLYDSLAAASRVDFAPPAPTTTTTTLAPGGTTTTTTSSTLPPEVECGQFPSGSFAAVDCWYGILTRVVGEASTEALGGPRRARRIQKRVGRIGRPIEKAEAGQRAAKRLAAGARRLTAFQRQIERLAAAGKMDAPLGVELSAVATGMSAELERLRAATP